MGYVIKPKKIEGPKLGWKQFNEGDFIKMNDFIFKIIAIDIVKQTIKLKAVHDPH